MQYLSRIVNYFEDGNLDKLVLADNLFISVNGKHYDLAKEMEGDEVNNKSKKENKDNKHMFIYDWDNVLFTKHFRWVNYINLNFFIEFYYTLLKVYFY